MDIVRKGFDTNYNLTPILYRTLLALKEKARPYSSIDSLDSLLSDVSVGSGCFESLSESSSEDIDSRDTETFSVSRQRGVKVNTFFPFVFLSQPTGMTHDFFIDLNGTNMSAEVIYQHYPDLPMYFPQNDISVSYGDYSLLIEENNNTKSYPSRKLPHQSDGHNVPINRTTSSSPNFQNSSQIYYSGHSPTNALETGSLLFSEPIASPRNDDVFYSAKTSLIPITYLRDFARTVPPKRRWRYFHAPQTATARSYVDLTVMSYNTLCPRFATFHQYPHCPPFALDTRFRQTAVLEEILDYSADIICLQELDVVQLDQCYKPVLRSHGYECEMVVKSRAHYDGDPASSLACAIFWRASKLEFVSKSDIRFHEFTGLFEEWNEKGRPANTTMVNRLMPRPNAAIVLFLRSKATQQYVCVTNGHLFWDPNYSDVKLMQTAIWTAVLLKHIVNFYRSVVLNQSNANSSNMSSDKGSFQQEWKNPSNDVLFKALRKIPIIFCGDLNSLPNSGVFQYLTNKGGISLFHDDFLNHSDGYAIRNWRLFKPLLNNQKSRLQHNIDLKNAYPDATDMPFTNYTPKFKGTIDYIFYSKRHFDLLACLAGIPKRWFLQNSHLNEFSGCPNPHIPSDHLSLVVKLRLYSNCTYQAVICANTDLR